MAGSDVKLAAGTQKDTATFRPDIEGLRAVAIGLVLLYHAGVDFVPGGFVGVDVFFVISGFLITGLLIREIERTGRVSLGQFWARRAKRLLPASALTLVVTAIATWLVVPATQWRDFGGDISAAALYVVNWRFAAEAVDYNAEGAGVSPVLHFWSLAVEEQFYIVWPLLIVVLVWLTRRWNRLPLRAVLTVAIAAVIVPSFLWSLSYTSANPEGAFFVTTTRLWELGVGAAVAIGAKHWPRLTGSFVLPLGWLGGTAIALAALQFSSSSPWPGASALLPTLGTAAVIVATTGRDVGAFGVGRVLGVRPLVWVGGLSYSLYLWHWPFLIIGAVQFGELGTKKSLALIAASAVVAWLSLKFVENPIRFSRSIAASSRFALSLGANLSLVGALAGAALVLAIPASAPQSTDADGARFLDTPAFTLRQSELSAVDSVSFVIPAPTDATRDLPEIQEEGCVVPQIRSEVTVCERGDPDGEVIVAVVGDSKILQWTTALTTIAEREGWRLLTYIKSACAFSDPSYDLVDEAREHCAAWNHDALQQIIEAAPDVVVTAGRGVFDGRTDDGSIEPGAQRIATWWGHLQDAGATVIPVLDNPAPPFEVYECVSENPTRLSECAFPRDRAIAQSGADFQVRAAELTGIKDVVDMADITCPGVERCPAVIGNVLVYRQGSHLTRTFVETATDALAERLVPLVDAAVAKG